MVELGRKAKLSSSHSSHSPQQTHSEHMQNIWYTKSFLDALCPNMSFPKQQNTCVPGSQSDFCLCHLSTEQKIHHLFTWISHLRGVFCPCLNPPIQPNGEHSKLESRIAKAAMILKGTMNHSLQSLAIETRHRSQCLSGWRLQDTSWQGSSKIEWILDQSLNLGF